jgi:iron complex outermembrane recepter protein
MVAVATRFENYSDFGTNFSWKVASRYELVEGIAVRGAISTGFKAPSLQQQYFSATSTNFISGIPYDIKTFPVGSAAAQAMGAKPLEAETSQNISAGLTVAKGDFSLTVDAYQIKINDRITFSNNFLRSASTTTFNALLDGIEPGIGGGRFFSNAINTTTKGVDFAAKYGAKVGEGTLRLLMTANLNKTDVTNAVGASTNAFIRTIPANTTLQGLGFTSLFGRDRLADYEVANPTDKESVQLQYELKKIGFLLRGTRYGEVWEISSRSTYGGGTTQASGANAIDPTTGYNPYDQKFSAKGIFDLEINARPATGITIALGANNIFDVYPDKRLKENSFSGITPYSGYSPFGFFGRYVFTRLTYSM